MTTNLVEALGAAYFNERCSGNIMVYEGAVVKVIESRRMNTEAHVLVTREGAIQRRITSVLIPNAIFTSFDIFRTPELGYRKVSNGTYRFHRSIVRAYASGFNPERLNITSSPATAAVENLGGQMPIRGVTVDAIKQLLFPEFDTISDATWPSLSSGRSPSLVLSGHMIVEPSLRTKDDVYDVFFDGLLVGSMLPDRSFTKATPPSNRKFIEERLGV